MKRMHWSIIMFTISHLIQKYAWIVFPHSSCEFLWIWISPHSIKFCQTIVDYDTNFKVYVLFQVVKMISLSCLKYSSLYYSAYLNIYMQII